MKTPADGWDRDEREALEPIEAELAAIRTRHAGDPPLELLRAARADALPPELQARVAAHLEASAWSRALVAGIDDVEPSLDAAGTDRLFARITRAAEPRRAWFRNTGVWAPLVAAAATVVVAVSLWPSERAAVPAPPAAPASPESAAARNQPPPFALPLDRPDVKLSVAALTWRGPTGGVTLVDALAPALDAYRRADYARAAPLLQSVERRYAGSIEAPFYRGISLLFLDDAAGAIGELQKAERMNDEAFAADVAWYLAVAEQRAGRIPEARAHLDALCRKASPRTAAACDALGKLGASR